MPTHPISSQDDSRYFPIQADIGISKHMGGRKATDELIDLCRIGPGQLVLEIGCGVGSTTCHLAQHYGCRVIAIDLSAGMIGRARERAARRGVEAQVGFQVADAQNLPFDDNTFDAVIDESVTAFVPDKQQAVREYSRVVKPGGAVGLNEATWIEAPPPEVVRYVAFVMAGADFQSVEGWRVLLAGADLGSIEVRAYPFDMRSQYAEELRQLDLREYAGAWRRFLSESLTNPAYRQFAKEILADPGSIRKFTQFIGHGLYTGVKEGDDGGR